MTLQHGRAKKGGGFSRHLMMAAVLFTCIATLAQYVFPETCRAQLTKENSCYQCHIRLGGRMKDSAVGWQMGIHRKVGVTCDMCHGGNAFISTEESMSEEYGYKGVFSPFEIPGLCASCHSDVSLMRQYNLRTDQYDEYRTSHHGQLLEEGDGKVATCVSCHGAHEIRKSNDPRSRVFHTNVPGVCAECHSDATLMGQYDLPHDQFDKFRSGYHGRILFGDIPGKNPMLVPNCATCHGIHGASPPGVKEVENVCGSCHSNIYRFFSMGPHLSSVRETGEPRCVDCHGNHSNVYPSLDLFRGTEPGKCGFCHEEEGEEYILGQKIRDNLEDLGKKVEEMVLRAKEARELGHHIERLNNAISTLRIKYIQLIPITHAVNLSILNPLLADARDQIKIAEEELGRIDAENRSRRRFAHAAVTLLFIVAGLLMIKLGRLNREQS